MVQPYARDHGLVPVGAPEGIGARRTDIDEVQFAYDGGKRWGTESCSPATKSSNPQPVEIGESR